MKHVIMGTAGHVDHGKTALIKALTGIDCDTHKEEKKRGITINLGFAHFDLPCGDSIGIVDVPGHKDFVHTMVGGASGIDFVVLVVAADSGVMPQTVEHLQIMHMLGIGSGLVVLTKVDMVDDELLELLEAEVRELTAGTFLAGCPLVRFSSKTGAGRPELVGQIERIAAACGNTEAAGGFRMFVDRIFTVSGFGSVVTGSVMSGSLRVDDAVYLLPARSRPQTCRVRRLERHGAEVAEIVAGDRASINLAGLDRSEFRRGMIVSEHLLQQTTRIDVRLALFPQSPPLKRWSQVVFHLGTYEAQARVHLIDRDRLPAGEEALAQITLTEPCMAVHGDRFVVRTSSSDVTLGGGEIIDPAPLHHRRRKQKTVAGMKQLSEQGASGLIFEEVRKRFRPVSLPAITENIHVPPGEAADITGRLPDDIVALGHADTAVLLVREKHDRYERMLLDDLRQFHREHFFEAGGRTIQELAGILQLASGDDRLYLELLLEDLNARGVVKQVAQTWALAGHDAVIDERMQRLVDSVTGYLKKCNMQTPLLPELEESVRKSHGKGVDGKMLKQALNYCVKTGRAYQVDGQYLYGPTVDACRNALVQALQQRSDGISLGEFRDLVQGNRKICLLLMNLFDAEHLTRRVGDRRFLSTSHRR